MRLFTKKAQQIVETLLLIAGAIVVLSYFTSERGPFQNTLKVSINRVVDNVYVQYRWDISPWTACPAACGSTGTRTRTVVCVDDTGSTVADSNCPQPKPATSEACDVAPCSGCNWRIGDWGPCLPNCGAVRSQSRDVDCVSFPYQTPCGSCPTPAPESTRACEPRTACGSWSQVCDGSCPVCGEDVTIPCTVTCNMGVTQVPDSYCDMSTRPALGLPCTGLPACYYWQFPSDPDAGWTACSLSCGGGTQTRDADCYDYLDFVVADSDCIDAGLAKPADEVRSCNEDACGNCAPLPADRAWCPGSTVDLLPSDEGTIHHVGPDETYCTGAKCEEYCTDTCETMGTMCGAATNSCGDTLSCGVCTAPFVCQDGLCVCVETTCEMSGYQCGELENGCGSVLDCGSCTSPEVCFGGTCCTPLTCAGSGVECGPLDDGCGSVLDCGNSCTLPEVCFGGTCCTPLECGASSGVFCGPLDDGCGSVLDCGSCTLPQVCTAGTCI